MKKRFWNWAEDKETEKRILRIEGVIGDGGTWYEDELTPKNFREELNAGGGDVTVWINSLGGDVFAASQIYTMLREYKGGVEVCIDGIAASAASVIAMAGDIVSMAPTAVIMIHDPMTFAAGNTDEFKAAIKMLDEIKESIINAYALKTKLSRDKISKMMTAETWLDAKKAVELGFADKILYSEPTPENHVEGLIYTRAAVINSFLNKIQNKIQNKREAKKMYQNDDDKPTRQPILANPQRFAEPFDHAESHLTFGVSGNEYRRNFFNELRTGFKTAYNYLQIATPAQGGYLVPAEFHDEIITALRSENVLRQISRVVTTANDRRIAVQATAPTAAFVAEGASIPLASETFDQKTLGAYKIAAAISVSNELLSDSYYDLEAHLVAEFASAIAATEENAFLNGTGSGEPLGILPQLAADSTTTITTSGTSVAADDIINLVYKLKRPYRKNAVFIANDSTIAALRKLKDNNGQYLWQQNMTAGEAPLLFGYPMYSSEFVPGIATGNISVIFGDFSKYIVGQRGEMVFKPLHEIHALQDLSTFIMTERVDGVLTDNHAIKGLKIR